MKNFTENEPIKTSENDRAEHRLAPCRGNLAKRIAAVALAGAMTVPIMLCLGACNITFTRNPDGTITVGPSGGTTTDPTPGKDDDTESNLSKYSDILKTVITSDYYKELSEIPGANITLTSQKRQQNPFGFLYQQGYDLSRYFNRELEIESDVYIKGNDTSHLYIASHVESEHEQGNYYTCYVLKYELTKQEYNDLVMLHEGRYVQAPLFIQELTYEKEATIESEARISKRIYTLMKDIVRRNKDFNIFGGNTFDIDFTGYNGILGLHGVTYSLNVRPSKKYDDNNMILPDNKIHYLSIKTAQVAGGLAIYGDNVFDGPLIGTATNLEQYQKEYETITYFESDDYKVNATIFNYYK